VVASIGPKLDLALGWRMASTSLAAQLQRWDEPQFMVASAASGMFEQPQFGIGTRVRLGKIGLTTSAERARLWRPESLRDRREDHISRFAVAVDGDQGHALDWRVGLGLMREDRTVLGARFAEALGGGGATTISLSPSLAWHPSNDWRLSTSGAVGVTRLDGGAIASSGNKLTTSSWTIDVTRQGLLRADDRLGFRLAQPMRVESGSVLLTLPVAYDYTSGMASFGQRVLSLSPKGREIDAELAWSAPLAQGAFAASLFWRHDPGHFSAAPDDKGAALRWTSGF
jgi:hypothetical protein